MTISFSAPARDKAVLEGEGALTPRFDDNGLVTAIVTDWKDGELLMVGHMNAEALALTIETGAVHYYSRSRARLWMKGETSGNRQLVREMRADCDQDAIWLKVEVEGHGATCHTGRRSCFYRKIELDAGQPRLLIVDDVKHFDPDEIYGK